MRPEAACLAIKLGSLHNPAACGDNSRPSLQNSLLRLVPLCSLTIFIYVHICRCWCTARHSSTKEPVFHSSGITNLVGTWSTRPSKQPSRTSSGPKAIFLCVLPDILARYLLQAQRYLGKVRWQAGYSASWQACVSNIPCTCSTYKCSDVVANQPTDRGIPCMDSV